MSSLQPTAQQWAHALELTRKGRGAWAGACPMCGGTDRFHVTERDGRARIGCRGCIDGEPPDVRRRRFGELVRQVFPDRPGRTLGTGAVSNAGIAHTRFSRQSGSGPNPPNSPVVANSGYPARQWAAAQPVPSHADHPVLRWIARRNLWRPMFPLPPALRMLPPDRRYPTTCAVQLVIPLAPIHAWIEAWPETPTPTAIQLIAIAGEGGAALDRPADAKGVGKRTHGPARGTVFAVGHPQSADVRVCEGAADALAVASRYDALVLATMSTPDVSDDDLVSELAGRTRVIIHADADRNVAGQGGALRLQAAISQAGGNARAVSPPAGFDDPADWAAGNPHEPIDRAVAREYADTLLAMYPEWPRWEIARLTSIAVAGG